MQQLLNNTTALSSKCKRLLPALSLEDRVWLKYKVISKKSVEGNVTSVDSFDSRLSFGQLKLEQRFQGRSLQTAATKITTLAIKH